MGPLRSRWHRASSWEVTPPLDYPTFQPKE